MPAADLLSVSAEISIAILGFAAIASILRGGSHAAKPDGRFWGMLALALGGLIASLAPLPFLSHDLDAARIWGASSFALALFLVMVALSMVIFVRGANVQAGVTTSVPIMLLFLTMILLAAAPATYNVSVADEAQFSLYFGSVVGLHIVTASVFVRILVVWLAK